MNSDPLRQENLPAAVPVSPDLLAWARQTFDEDAFIREMREIETTGGCELESFIDELKIRAGVS